MSADGSVSIEITGDSSQLENTLSNTGKMVENSLNKSFDDALNSIQTSINSISNGIMSLNETAVNGFNNLINAAEKLSDSFQNIPSPVPEETKPVDVLSEKLKSLSINAEYLAAQMGLLDTKYSENTHSADYVNAKTKLLKDTYSNLNDRLNTLNAQLREATAKFGKNSNEAVILKTALAQTETELRNVSAELKNVNNASDGIKNISGGIKNISDAADGTEPKISNMAQTMQIAFGNLIAVAIQKVVSGIIDLGKEAFSAYANYEQLVGGVDTLFKGSSQKIQEYAENAYKTAGLSANNYMETVTSFSASLISSLGGDTEKAVQYADMAITDMSDNANKMGTDMAAIQNAYQGFAKQNYTMLDNLKLGYGGTKEEMARLLADAEAISGIHYDVSSYADVVSAIHIIQESMDIAGTTALEAELTISGSLNSLKAATDNLKAGLGNADADITRLCDNVVNAFQTVVQNITPIVENVIKTLPVVIETLLTTIIDTLPKLIPAAVDTVKMLANTIIKNLPLLTDSAVKLVAQLASDISGQLPELIPAAVDAVIEIVNGLIDNIPMLIDAAVELIVGLTEGLVKAVPKLLEAAPEIIMGLVGGLLELVFSFDEVAYSICDTIGEGLANFDFDEFTQDTIDKLVDSYNKAVDNCTDRLIKVGEKIDRFINPKNYTDDTPDYSEYANKTREELTKINEINNEELEFYKQASRALIDAGYDENNLPAEMLEKLKQDFPDDDFNALHEKLNQHIGALLKEQAKINEAFRGFFDVEDSGEIIGNITENAFGDTLLDAEVDIENLKDISDEVQKVSDEFKDAYKNLQMHKIYGDYATDEAYYDALSALLDEHHAYGISAYNQYYKEIADFNEKEEAASLKAAREVSDAFKDAYENLDMRKAYGDISSDEEYYSELAKLLDEHHAYGNSAYKKYYKSISDFKQKQQDELLKKQLTAYKNAQKNETSALKSSLSDITSEYEKQYNDIVKLQDEYSKKIKSQLDIFSITENKDKNTKTYSINNIKEYQKAVKEYTETMSKLKNRGLDSSLMSELMDMDMEDASFFGKNLLSMSESEFAQINDSYKNITQMIDTASKELYQTEIETLNDGFISDVSKLFEGLPAELKGLGFESAQAFVDGLNSNSGDIAEQTKTYFDNLFSDVSDAINMQESAGNTANKFVDNLLEQITGRSDELSTTIADMLNDQDFSINIKAIVDSEVSYASTSASSAKNSSSLDKGNSNGKGVSVADIERLINKLSPTVQIVMDRRIIGEAVIDYANSKNKSNGGTVIK